MIDRINAFVTRRFGVGTNVASFVRIHVWIVVFLVVISLVLPSREVRAPKRSADRVWTQNLTLDYSDPRGFAPSPFGKDRFRVAWITGSEGLLLDADYRKFLPSLVAEQLRSVNARRVGVDLYFLYGIRIGDIYLALLDAIRSGADMIVVSLNPAWALNPIATHQWTQLDSRGSQRLLSEPPNWPLAAALFSPADLAWGVADNAFRPLHDRYYYAERVRRFANNFGPMDRTERNRAEAERKPTRYQQILSTTPVDFWFRYRLHVPRGLGADRWARWMQPSNEGKSTLNEIILRAVAKELRDSKIPSYVYTAPVNSEWLKTSEPIEAALGGVERQLGQFRDNFSAPSILYQPRTATRFLPPLEFHRQDLMHMNRAGPLVPYLAGELCELLDQVQYTSPGCTSLKGGAGGG